MRKRWKLLLLWEKDLIFLKQYQLLKRLYITRLVIPKDIGKKLYIRQDYKNVLMVITFLISKYLAITDYLRGLRILIFNLAVQFSNMSK